MAPQELEPAVGPEVIADSSVTLRSDGTQELEPAVGPEVIGVHVGVR